MSFPQKTDDYFGISGVCSLMLQNQINLIENFNAKERKTTELILSNICTILQKTRQIEHTQGTSVIFVL